MKVKSEKKKTRPFLVLPLLENFTMPTKTNLKLFTKTWKTQKPDEKERPLTATLDKPTVLNVGLVGLIDMSTIRKEFLDISNLIRIAKPAKVKKGTRPLSLPSNDKFKKRPRRPETSEDSWEEEETLSIPSGRRTRLISKSTLQNSAKVAENSKIPKSANNKRSDANNNNNNSGSKTFKIPRKRSNVAKLLKVAGPGASNGTGNNLAKSTKLPEPCKTCGRPDQPERFHSHPVTPLKPAPKKVLEEPTPKMKSTVQKPVAIKYKSKQTQEKRPLVPPPRKPSLPAQKLVHTPPNLHRSKNDDDEPKSTTSSGSTSRGSRVGSAKRTLTCYICGREFGTASLSLHVPKCLEKWERENANLPPSMRRKPPVKPDHQMTPEEWNKFAWESSQATLTPCPKCGRTFFPDRLLVHQRSCKIVHDNENQAFGTYSCGTNSTGTKSITVFTLLFTSSLISSLQSSKSPLPSFDISTATSMKSPSSRHQTPPAGNKMKQQPFVECYICGRKIGTHSIKIHEKACLRRWHLENDALPPHLRKPEPEEQPVFNQILSPPAGSIASNSSSKLSGFSGIPARSSEEKLQLDSTKTGTSSGKVKSPLFPCYICGRLFTVHSIYHHEPQCLKAWKVENDKLPPSKRRAQPLKPDVKFTREGKIDYGATNEANWQSHLNQLIPCKYCSRTFNPDRVEVHERSCKG